MLLGLAPLVLAALVAAGLLLEPDPRGVGTHERLGLLPCLPMELWGFPCPGCGITTSVTLAAHGRLLASARNQPFGFLVAVVLAGFVLWAPLAHFRGGDLWRELSAVRLGRWAPVVAAFFVLSWLYKVVLVRGWS